MTTDTRKEIMARMLDIAEKAIEAGGSYETAIREHFPDVPDEVLTEVWIEIEDNKTERWWQKMERRVASNLIEFPHPKEDGTKR
ncbi:hypothetical protein [Thalassospira sp. UBA1131]|uniref:hypothetical protein n=1 Tax=Thalassospira sp. UBA1131 TaxID=1947672 RepID=UPI0025CFEC0D|nr:hypothetical protein [Thalassospira sp. UBA1131]